MMIILARNGVVHFKPILAEKESLMREMGDGAAGVGSIDGHQSVMDM